MIIHGLVDVELPDNSSSHGAIKEEHDYCVANQGESKKVSRNFAKCKSCRKSRTKIMLPKSFINSTESKDDGKTCDFCGFVMQYEEEEAHIISQRFIEKTAKNIILCPMCQKPVQTMSLNKHILDIHEKSNQRKCQLCDKVLSGPYSLKEHISAVHEKLMKYHCPHCEKAFSHGSNMNRHIRLVHEKVVVVNKYTNCEICQKMIQVTSLTKHMNSVHNNLKSFTCSYCHKGFTQSYTLKVSLTHSSGIWSH